MKPGNTYCNYSNILRLHIFTFVKEYKGRLLFFDTVDGNIMLFTKIAVEKALTTDGEHPKHRVKVFDFIEELPPDVFDVIVAETDKKLSKEEPKVIDLFKCVKN